MGLSRRMGVTGRAARAVRKVALAAFVLATGVGAVTEAWAQGASCAQLEASLLALDRGGNAAAQQAQAAKIRSDLDRLSGQARGMGCDAPRGFLIFQGPPRPPQCDQISDQISRLRSSLAGIERGGSDQSGQRRALIVALAQNNCGPQYTAAVQAARRSEPQRPKNFFEAIFGAPQNDVEESSPDIDLPPLEQARPSYSRTVCVRTCDGYFFPLSSATNSSRFAAEDQLCKRLCPASETQLFTYGGDIKSAVSISGQSYMSLPNALRYRKELVPSCTCKPVGQSWAQALAGVEDETTLKKGDILVTEEQAREMSQPKFNDPGQGGKGKGQANKGPTAAEAAGGPVTATADAPLAPASEQPGQRQVRVVPMPRSQARQSSAGQGTGQ